MMRQSNQNIIWKTCIRQMQFLTFKKIHCLHHKKTLARRPSRPEADDETLTCSDRPEAEQLQEDTGVADTVNREEAEVTADTVNRDEAEVTADTVNRDEAEVTADTVNRDEAEVTADTVNRDEAEVTADTVNRDEAEVTADTVNRDEAEVTADTVNRDEAEVTAGNWVKVQCSQQKDARKFVGQVI